MSQFRITAVVGFILLLVLSACAGESNDSVREAPSPTDPATAPVEEPAAPEAPSPAVDLSTLLDASESRPPGVDTLAVLDRLPSPQRVTVETRPNQHRPDATDTLRTYHYDSLTFTVIHAANGKELMESVTVTGQQYTSARGLEVGMSRSAVQQALGQPTRVDDGEAVYEIGEPTPTVVRVAYQNDEVDELSWHFYVD